MIRRCTPADTERIASIINEAAEAYRGVVPADQWHEPYMPGHALDAEIEAGVAFWGWDGADGLVGVMGLQRVKDATLIRHAYVRRDSQRHGVGGKLMAALADQARGRLLVGTWAAAHWAIRFYERHGFRLVWPPERERLLDTYWTIPAKQRDASVVLIREA
jgi:GNAT superfamily N-acetyltransferase